MIVPILGVHFRCPVLFRALKIQTTCHSSMWLVTETHPLLFCPLPLQGEDPLADSALTFVDQTSALTYAPASQEGHPMGHPLQTLSRPQPDNLSPKGDRRVDKRNALGQLMSYLAYKPPSSTKTPLTPYDLMRMPWRGPQKRLSPPEDPNDAPGLDDGKPASPPPLVFLLLTPSIFLAPSQRWSPTASGVG